MSKDKNIPGKYYPKTVIDLKDDRLSYTDKGYLSVIVVECVRSKSTKVKIGKKEFIKAMPQDTTGGGRKQTLKKLRDLGYISTQWDKRTLENNIELLDNSLMYDPKTDMGVLIPDFIHKSDLTFIRKVALSFLIKRPIRYCRPLSLYNCIGIDKGTARHYTQPEKYYRMVESDIQWDWHSVDKWLFSMANVMPDVYRGEAAMMRVSVGSQRKTPSPKNPVLTRVHDHCTISRYTTYLYSYLLYTSVYNKLLGINILSFFSKKTVKDHFYSVPVEIIWSMFKKLSSLNQHELAAVQQEVLSTVQHIYSEQIKNITAPNNEPVQSEIHSEYADNYFLTANSIGDAVQPQAYVEAIIKLVTGENMPDSPKDAALDRSIFHRSNLGPEKKPKKVYKTRPNKFLDTIFPEVAPTLVKHKRGTKIYHETALLIKHMLAGTLPKCLLVNFGIIANGMVNRPFWSGKKITKAEIVKIKHRKFTEEDIINLAKKMELLFSDKYHPGDKTFVPRSFLRMFYNSYSRTGFSWGVYLLLRETPRIQLVDPPTDDEKRLLEEFMNRFYVDPENEIPLLLVIRRHIEYHDKHITVKVAKAGKEHFFYFMEYWDYYLAYIQDNYRGDSINPWEIAVDGRFHTGAIREINEQLGFGRNYRVKFFYKQEEAKAFQNDAESMVEDKLIDKMFNEDPEGWRSTLNG